jgi:hypothetical protein
MLPVSGARSEVLYEGSSGSTSAFDQHSAMLTAHTAHTIVQKVVLEYRIVVIVGILVRVARQPTGHVDDFFNQGSVPAITIGHRSWIGARFISRRHCDTWKTSWK